MHLLIDKLHAKIEAGELVVDLAEWYKYLLFDIIGELAYGQPFLNLENQADQPWISSVMGGSRLAVRLMQIGAFIPLEYILWLLPKSLMAQQLAIFEFTRNRVSERLALETDKPNIMSYIIRHKNEDTGKGLISRGEMDSTFVDLIVAGSDTSATTLSSATYYLTKNPDLLRRLSEEVRSAFPTGDRIIIASASKLPYLLAVLEESLHLHPPVPISLPRVVPPGEATVSGHWVPGEMIPGIPQLAAYRSPLHFADPTFFVPERHLVVDDPKFENDSKAILQPLSFDPRSCIGKTLAYAQMSLLLAKMIWSFDMELVDHEKDWADQDVYLLYQKTPLNIRLAPRQR